MKVFRDDTSPRTSAVARKMTTADAAALNQIVARANETGAHDMAALQALVGTISSRA